MKCSPCRSNIIWWLHVSRAVLSSLASAAGTYSRLCTLSLVLEHTTYDLHKYWERPIIGGWSTRCKVSLRSWGTRSRSHMRNWSQQTSRIRLNFIPTLYDHLSWDFWRSCKGQESHDPRSHAKEGCCERNQQFRQTQTCLGEIYTTHNGDVDQRTISQDQQRNRYGCSPIHDKKWASVSGSSLPNLSDTKISGRELMHDSTSWMIVSKSVRLRQLAHLVCFKTDSTDCTSLSHQPPHQVEWGAMKFHFGARWPNCLCNAIGLAVNCFALSE